MLISVSLQLGYKTSTNKLDHIMNELDINQDGRVEFVEFMRPTAKKFKEEQELERGADADRYHQNICKYWNTATPDYQPGRAFEYFDKNFNTKLTAQEVLHHILEFCKSLHVHTLATAHDTAPLPRSSKV